MPPAPDAQPVFRFGPFRLDRARRVLWKGDDLLAVGPRAVDLLIALADEPGEVVTKNELLSRVWPDTFVEEANLTVHVSALRKALGDGEDGRRYIQTVPRRGYRLLPPPPEPDVRPTLAVRPFRVLSRAAEDEHLGIGIAVALVARLSRLPGIVVRSSSATLRHAAHRSDARTAARELQVRFVLDGTIQRSGSRVRITVDLESEEGVTWSKTFEEEFTQLFDVQDAAAKQVAEALAVELRGRDRALLARRDTDDVEAYQAYLKGRYFWSRFTAPWMERAFVCFQDAASRDPAYALPHAGLADAYLILGFTGLLDPLAAWEMADGAAAAALRLDRDLAEAHVSAAYVHLFRDWNWAAAEDELSRAVGLAPTAASHQWLGLFLDMQGRFAEARACIDRACALEPLSIVTAALRGFQLYLADDKAAELEQYRAVVEMEPHHFLGYWGLGLALSRQGRLSEARAAHERAVQLAEGHVVLKSILARTVALAGHREEALALLASGPDEPAVSEYQRATVLLALGENDAAIDHLGRAAARREPWMVWIMVDPMLHGVRDDPRFGRLVGTVMQGAAVSRP